MKTTYSSSSGFTLIELLVVLTLLSIVAGMTFVRIDGLIDDARLRGCAANHASVMKLAQVQAKSSGEPRLIEYAAGSLLLRKPAKLSGAWNWDEGMSFDLPAGVKVAGILTQREDTPTKQTIRISADGRVGEHAVMYQVHERHLVALFSSLHEPKHRSFNHRPEFSDWSNVLELISKSHEKP